jgi:hypothetical protein
MGKIPGSGASSVGNYAFSKISDGLLPVDIVLAPEWWHKNENIVFDSDFFFNPLKRVEAEKHMEKVLYDRWGNYGLGKHRNEDRPEIGAVHLAAGFLLSEMLGCKVDYTGDRPPQVYPAYQELREINTDEAFKSEAFKRVMKLVDSLNSKYGYLTGDINWGGILNIAMYLRGESVFMDMMIDQDKTNDYFRSIFNILNRFTTYIKSLTGTTSISVNRCVGLIDKPVLLHSECSHTMISADDYENFLLPFDIEWSKKRPFGIHYCGSDPHRMAESFAKIPHLDYLDLGWGGDIEILRRHLPDTFFNIRLSPVEIARMDKDLIRTTVTDLIHKSGNPYLTGICCINMDDKITDDRIDVIFETVAELRNEYTDFLSTVNLI